MVKLRHGFKKECEDYAREFRDELGLDHSSPLHARDLAKHLDIDVHDLSRFSGIPDSQRIRFLSSRFSSEFSATVLRVGERRSILHNDSHHPNRQNSNIMHEIAHTILRHPPTVPLNGPEVRRYNSQIEREAVELSFALLIPKPAALFAIERFASLMDAADYYGVSKELLVYRIRITNAQGWAKNRARKFA